MSKKLGSVFIVIVVTLLMIFFSSDLTQSQENMPPQPIDGAEFFQRKPRPVSNSLLQRQYPNTLVLRGSAAQDKIALTFDDGPDPRFTPHVLDVLKKYDVKATFFVMGSRANAYPEIIKRIEEEGHAIGNHTYWHPNLPKYDLDRLRWETNETEKVLEESIGYRPRLFRAPYGALTEDIVEEMQRTNHTIVGWSVDSLDWRQLPVDEIARNVLSNIHTGAIILMHDGGHWTMNLSGTYEALDQIIPALLEEGMEFSTIPELIGLRNQRVQE